jgi:hypothetical protein
VSAAAQTANWPISDDLAAALARDNRAEDNGMPTDQRRTCWPHQCWAEECADHLMHTDPAAFEAQQRSRIAA